MRQPLLVSIAVVLTAGTACSAAFSGNPIRMPPISELPAAQVIFQITGGGGLEPLGYIAASRPGLTIYGNGAAYVVDADLTHAPGTPWALRKGTVAVQTLAALVDAAADSGLFDEAEFGDPDFMDAGGTVVTFRPGAAPARRAVAPALYVQGGDERVTIGQRVRRVQLRRFSDRLERSINFPDTRDGAEWAPNRVDVTERSGADDSTAAVPWPGPPLDNLLKDSPGLGKCGLVAGAAAARLYAAARRHGSTHWRVGGSEKYLLVRALLPGEPACWH